MQTPPLTLTEIA